MKITIEKTAQLVIDTSKERKRIDQAWRGHKDGTIRKKLHKLMDLIEAGKWEAAVEELDSKWWCGYDNEAECPRHEFIGKVQANSLFFDNYMNYMDLVFYFINYPKNYKVISCE